MICKDSVLTWFKGLASHTRIDLMCSLLNKCLPFELRFLGTCLENLGRQDFSQMKDFEVKANNASELGEFHTQAAIIGDARMRQKLAVFVCLLHSLNTACSTIIYKSLYGIDIDDVVTKARNSDDKLLEELLTIYTVAVNHPAFTFEQRSNLGSILLRLKKEENRLQSEKLAEVVNADYVHAQLDEPPRPDVPPPAVPPGMGYPPGGVMLPMYFPGQHQLPNQPILVQLVNYPAVAGEAGGPTASPLLSRHSSPSQSTHHSRNSSPSRKQFPPPKTRPLFSEPPPTAPFIERPDVPSKESPINPDCEVRNVSERLMGLSTEEMLRGAAVSLNGMAGPVSRPPPPNHQRLPYEPELALPYNPAVPPGPRTQLIHSRYNQQLIFKENSHSLEERNCSSSSSGSDVSSTSHSPPTTPAALYRTWDRGHDNDDYRSRVGMGRGRGRYGGQTLPRERGPVGAHARREGPRSAPPTPHEESKSYSVPPPTGDMGPGRGADMLPAAAPAMQFAAPFMHGPFTTAPPLFQPYPPPFVRPPYSYPNGEVLYTYQPAPATPFPPSALVTYTSSVPPPKIACYNCSSQTHHPNDCKEPTMEEYCSKGQYRIDYGKSSELLDK